MDENKEIAEEILRDEEAKIAAQFEPKKISKNQVKAAKYTWMGITVVVDAATAYAYTVILDPYWWYGFIWFLVGAGGLIFSEWLWERIGNNDEQRKIASASKNTSAIAVFIMALLAGFALVMGWSGQKWMEVFAMASAIGMSFFHGLQAYRYHEVDDEYISETEDALADANSQKEIRNYHRAGMRVKAKKAVRNIGSQYRSQHGAAFDAALGKQYAKDMGLPQRLDNKNPTSDQPER